MSEIRLQMRCPSCGARNRLRLPAGKKLRVTCGGCREPLPIGRGRLLRAWAAWQARRLFTHGLPLALLALIDLLVKMLGLLLFPLVWGWKKMSEPARQRVIWSLIVVLGLGYLYLEGANKLGDLLNLGLIIFGVSLGMLILMRGPRALLDRIREAAGGTLHRCRHCGHGYSNWLKSCPKCGHEK